MGNLFSKKRHLRFLMTGPEGSGKTTILYRLRLEEVLTNVIHTIGCNIEKIEHNGFSFTIFDVGGGAKIKPLWVESFKDSDGVIFVVDSHDRESMEEAKDMLRIEDEVRQHGEALFLILANKWDKADTMSVEEIEEKLDLKSLRNRNWHILASSATSEPAQGLYEGLDWLTNQLTEEKLSKLAKIRSRNVKVY